ncbi:hypothetical protein AB0M23_27485 [Streptomyces sp. NPDC052077]|uniref:hypothetical protein n=1 Tax=Streptomyces sp. NPDC052077 TaxID=3154757 RepID=UPI00342C55A2
MRISLVQWVPGAVRADSGGANGSADSCGSDGSCGGEDARGTADAPRRWRLGRGTPVRPFTIDGERG